MFEVEPTPFSVLITGGSGFLGRALARRILDKQEATRVCIYSRGEHAQAQMFEDLGCDERLRMFIGDVRDAERLAWAMKGVDVVIHAAALKRIEVGHYNPIEMVKTNVNGAMNVVAAAIANDVRRAVLVSTDKAYQPVSPYGLSKGMAEAIFLAANNTVHMGGPQFSVCRYGNVAGSTGSIIPKWRAQIAAGRAVTMTDPRCTRFWMTVDQAVNLVLGAALLDEHRYMHIPELPAFTVGDLAQAMGADVEMTRLGSWEKMHESMDGLHCSADARRMTVDELKEALTHV